MAVTNELFKLDMLKLCMKLDHKYACTSCTDILDMNMSIVTA
jgi:hypothetical protein